MRLFDELKIKIHQELNRVSFDLRCSQPIANCSGQTEVQESVFSKRCGQLMRFRLKRACSLCMDILGFGDSIFLEEVSKANPFLNSYEQLS